MEKKLKPEWLRLKIISEIGGKINQRLQKDQQQVEVKKIHQGALQKLPPEDHRMGFSELFKLLVF